MAENIYTQSFDAAVKELSDLMQTLENLDIQRESVKARILNVKKGVMALSPLIGKDPLAVKDEFPHLFPDLITPDTGLTDAVRKILKSRGGSLSAVGVRSALESSSFDTGKYKNLLAAVHTILKRLLEAGEVTSNTSDEVTAYKWKQELPPLTEASKPISIKFSPEQIERARKLLASKKLK